MVKETPWPGRTVLDLCTGDAPLIRGFSPIFKMIETWLDCFAVVMTNADLEPHILFCSRLHISHHEDVCLIEAGWILQFLR